MHKPNRTEQTEEIKNYLGETWFKAYSFFMSTAYECSSEIVEQAPGGDPNGRLLCIYYWEKDTEKKRNWIKKDVFVGFLEDFQMFYGGVLAGIKFFKQR